MKCYRIHFQKQERQDVILEEEEEEEEEDGLQIQRVARVGKFGIPLQGSVSLEEDVNLNRDISSIYQLISPLSSKSEIFDITMIIAANISTLHFSTLRAL